MDMDMLGHGCYGHGQEHVMTKTCYGRDEDV